MSCHCTNDWNSRSVKLTFSLQISYDNTNGLTKSLTLFVVEECSTVITIQAFWQRNAAVYPFTLLFQRSSVIIQVSSILQGRRHFFLTRNITHNAPASRGPTQSPLKLVRPCSRRPYWRMINLTCIGK